MAQPNLPAVTAIVVAAGASRRMGFDKLSYRLPDGRTVLETSCAALAAHPAITQLVLVCGGNRAACEAIAAACPKPCAVVQGATVWPRRRASLLPSTTPPAPLSARASSPPH